MTKSNNKTTASRKSTHFCEQADDGEAHFWSLYGHIPRQGLQCIGDFEFRQAAEEVYARITGRVYCELPITATCGNEAVGVLHAADDRKPRMYTNTRQHEHSAEIDELLTHLDATFFVAEDFGCFVCLSPDQTTIFCCTMNADGSPERFVGNVRHLDWGEVTAPAQGFLELVNGHYGTSFRYENFSMR